MKTTKTLFISLLLFFVFNINAQNQYRGYPITPVSFTNVKVTDNFWGQRLKANKEVTIPLAFSKCEESGRIQNFINAAHPNDTIKVKGYPFDDTDVYKTIEGASYSLQTTPDKKLEHYVDSIVNIIAAAQEPDGYLYTARTMNPKHPNRASGDKRWVKEEELSHELYDLGHLIESACAHYQATGKTKYFNIAKKFADVAVKQVGDKPGQIEAVSGHQIAEMALARLYVITGEKKYLDFAKYLLDKRGNTNHKEKYSQSHKPVTEQDEAVGHAVRASYMYSGMADVASLTGDSNYIHAVDNIWDNIVSKKLYITGGIGATGNGEAFGENYELPNMSAYCETCAAIGNEYLNYRLFLLHGESKYIDVMERTLYNGLISGVSLDGGKFFYPNPLASMGQDQREPWFGCACCPGNIARFIPSLPGYVYAVKDNSIYVNLFMSNKANIKVGKKDVELIQETDYPWNGKIVFTVNPKKKQDINIKIRIPGWLQNQVVPSDLYRFADNAITGYTIRVNGQELTGTLDKGYFNINRKWKKGDKIEVIFDIIPRTVKSNTKVQADKGKVSVEYGPLIYCAEWPDNDFDIFSVLMTKKPKFTVEFKPDLLKGINIIKTEAQSLSYSTEGKLATKDVTLTLIPYYAWAHRGSGNMAVWLPDELSATNATPAPTIASESKIDASYLAKSISAINDRLTPKDEDDGSVPYYHWWPTKDTTEWVSYTFDKVRKVSKSTVYWFDDGPRGGCRVPQSWKLYYKGANNDWIPVQNTSLYPTEKGVGNLVNFMPVETKALKLEIMLPNDNSSGIFEWEVE